MNDGWSIRPIGQRTGGSIGSGLKGEEIGLDLSLRPSREERGQQHKDKVGVDGVHGKRQDRIGPRREGHAAGLGFTGCWVGKRVAYNPRISGGGMEE